MTKLRKGKVNKMKDERVKEAFEKIEKGVGSVFESEKWQKYLKVISKFHNYSANNCFH